MWCIPHLPLLRTTSTNSRGSNEGALLVNTRERKVESKNFLGAEDKVAGEKSWHPRAGRGVGA